jgi:hypothetical protein
VQAARSGTECDIAGRRVLVQLRSAVPDANTAVDARFTIPRNLGMIDKR